MNLKATFTPINKKKPQKRQEELNHRHYLEGFQHIERSIDLAYDKLIFKKPHSYDRQIELFQIRKKMCSLPPETGSFNKQISFRDETKMNYYRKSLNSNFSYFLADDIKNKPTLLKQPITETTQNWIIKKKANRMLKLIYKEEANKHQHEIQSLNQIRVRLKLLDNIKKEKKKIIENYFKV